MVNVDTEIEKHIKKINKDFDTLSNELKTLIAKQDREDRQKELDDFRFDWEEAFYLKFFSEEGVKDSLKGFG